MLVVRAVRKTDLPFAVVYPKLRNKSKAVLGVPRTRTTIVVTCLQHILPPRQLVGDPGKVVILTQGEVAEVHDHIILTHDFAPSLHHDDIMVATERLPRLSLIMSSW